VHRRRPERTRAGDRFLDDLRLRHPELPARDMSSGEASIGLALALAGTGVLAATDPALALAVEPGAGEASGMHRWWGDGGASGGGYAHGCSGGGSGCSGGGGGGCGGGGCGG
jgi:hypothetical protein